MLSGSSGFSVTPLLIQPNSSVVAVHGLGADPAWAWVGKVGVEGSDQYKKVNWLADKDLLPAKIPHARIMTFNYESKWHKDSPKQRRALCADQLLAALDNKRKAVRHFYLRFLLTLTLTNDRRRILNTGPSYLLDTVLAESSLSR